MKLNSSVNKRGLLSGKAGILVFSALVIFGIVALAVGLNLNSKASPPNAPVTQTLTELDGESYSLINGLSGSKTIPIRGENNTTRRLHTPSHTGCETLLTVTVGKVYNNYAVVRVSAKAERSGTCTLTISNRGPRPIRSQSAEIRFTVTMRQTPAKPKSIAAYPQSLTLDAGANEKVTIMARNGNFGGVTTTGCRDYVDVEVTRPGSSSATKSRVLSITAKAGKAGSCTLTALGTFQGEGHPSGGPAPKRTDISITVRPSLKATPAKSISALPSVLTIRTGSSKTVMVTASGGDLSDAVTTSGCENHVTTQIPTSGTPRRAITVTAKTLAGNCTLTISNVFKLNGHQANWETKTDTVRVVVQKTPAVKSISASPSSLSLQMGTSRRMTVTAHNGDLSDVRATGCSHLVNVTVPTSGTKSRTLTVTGKVDRTSSCTMTISNIFKGNGHPATWETKTDTVRVNLTKKSAETTDDEADDDRADDDRAEDDETTVTGDEEDDPKKTTEDELVQTGIFDDEGNGNNTAFLVVVIALMIGAIVTVRVVAQKKKQNSLLAQKQ